METQLLYLLSILMAVGFGYFVASTMFRNERNGLIAQGRNAGEAQRSELEEQVKLQETRVQEIEKERVKDQEVIEKLREENGKLRLLHNEADQRVAEARRSAEEYWQQIVADAKQGTDERLQSPSTDIGGRPTHEQLQQAVEEARRTAEEQWQQTAADARAEAELERSQAAARLAEWETKLAELNAELRQAREDAAAAVAAANAAAVAAASAAAPVPATETANHPTYEQLQQAVEEARRTAEEQWQHTAAEARAEAEHERTQAATRLADWETKLTELNAELQQAREDAANAVAAASAAAPVPATETASHPTYEQLQQAVADARRTAEEQWQQAAAEARAEAEQERTQAVARLAEWETKLAELNAELQQARENSANAVAAQTANHPTYEQLQQAVAGARRAAEEQWQQAADEARAEAEQERTQAAARLAEWEMKLTELNAELQQAREEAAHAVTAANAAAQVAAASAAPPIAAVEVPVAAQPATPALDHQSMMDAFRSVAAEALHANNEKFLDLARVALERIQETAQPQPAGYPTAVNELIDPIRETLAKVDTNLGQMERERQNAFANLTDLVNHLIQQGKDLRQETTGLARALRPAAAHGRWGELQLRRVVELAGMLEHCDYEEQPALAGNGSGQEVLRPEMVVHLPNHRDIVVDANVSLSAYLESLEALDDAVRTVKLRAHAGAVRAHLQRLSSANYWSQFTSAPEFIVAFLPSETVFSAALEQDPALIEFGAENRVILATPTTLIALLKATAYGWQQQQLADNARAVSELGKTLYERLISFTGHMDDLRRNLDRSVDSYNRGVASLESRVLVSARRFQELAAIDAPEIPALDPVETLPRSLQALKSATGKELAAPPAIEAPTAPVAVADGEAAVPVIELPIVPPMAPVIVCEPRVVSEAHVVSEPRIVKEPTFVNEGQSVHS